MAGEDWKRGPRQAGLSHHPRVSPVCPSSERPPWPPQFGHHGGIGLMALDGLRGLFQSQ